MSALREFDPEVFSMCMKEKERQKTGLELIASENFASKAVLQALSCCYHNKYSEGYPGDRYYEGTECIDELELLCQKRALQCYRVSEDEWGVNVQCHSGSPANFAVLTALVGPQGKIMGLNLIDGGHLTHGYQTPSGRKVSATSLYFESMSYDSNPKTGEVDYEAMEEKAMMFKPKILIVGTSSYTKILDYAKFRKAADKCGAILMGDMAHVSGLVAAGVHPSPFEYCDIVTSTTHKTLRGPRHGLVFYRKTKYGTKGGDGNLTNYGQLINAAVFPGLQGGPHNHTITALAVAFKEAMTPEYKEYQMQVLKNMKVLCNYLLSKDISLISGGSDVHQCLIDLRPLGLEGFRGVAVMTRVKIITNKNTLPGDSSALKPGGVRIGTAAVTTRGFKEEDMIKVGQFIVESIEIAKLANSKVSDKKLQTYYSALDTDPELVDKITTLRENIEEFSSTFDMPGLDY